MLTLDPHCGLEEVFKAMATLGSLLVTLSGFILLVIILLDILTTTFHPSTQGWLTERLNRAVCMTVITCSNALPARRRSALLSWTLPISMSSLLLFWLLLILAGFALVYAPGMSDPRAFKGAGRLGWSDALYLSGQCITSIGFGDVVPLDGLYRAVSVGEGMIGLLVVGVIIAYALQVFPVLPGLRVLAATLNEETEGEPTALPMVRRYLATDSAETLAARCRELATDLRNVTEAHSMHPVLFYAHPKRPELSFLRVLIVSQQLILVLRSGLVRADYRILVRDPRVVGLEETFIEVLRRLGASMHLRVVDTFATDGNPELDAAFDTLVGTLRQVGLRSEAPPTPRERREYVRFRLVTDRYIRAYWANTAYSQDELWGSYPPLRGATAPMLDEPGEDDLS
jgi:hypothetical protein